MQTLVDSLRFACSSAGLLTEAKATPKQAAYAHALAKQNPDVWTGMAAGLGLGPSPTLDDFKAMDMKDISKIITDLKNNKKATPKQIGFALSLMMQIGAKKWKAIGFEKMYGKPSSTVLRNMSMPQMNSLISDLKDWAWKPVPVNA